MSGVSRMTVSVPDSDGISGIAPVSATSAP